MSSIMRIDRRKHAPRQRRLRVRARARKWLQSQLFGLRRRHNILCFAAIFAAKNAKALKTLDMSFNIISVMRLSRESAATRAGGFSFRPPPFLIGTGAIAMTPTQTDRPPHPPYPPTAPNRQPIKIF